MRERWEDLLGECAHLDALYQSPVWVSHLRATAPETSLRVGIVQADGGSVVGVLPLLEGEHRLVFDIRARPLWQKTLHTVSVLGSLPLLRDGEGLMEQVFQDIWQGFPGCECIYLDSVPEDSALWRYLEHAGRNHPDMIVYVPDGLRAFHISRLPETFDAYLARFSSKKRNLYRRKLKKLQEHGGRLQVMRVEREDQVPHFLEGASRVARNSWQERRIGVRIDNTPAFVARLGDLARRGVLRAYLLTGEAQPYAFVVGCQYREVYHYNEVAYDASYAPFSPGALLVYLLIEDLIGYKPPQYLNFGVGHARYKQEFANLHGRDASVYLLKRDLSHALLVSGHAAFRSFVGAVRRMVRREDKGGGAGRVGAP